MMIGLPGYGVWRKARMCIECSVGVREGAGVSVGAGVGVSVGRMVSSAMVADATWVGEGHGEGAENEKTSVGVAVRIAGRAWRGAVDRLQAPRTNARSTKYPVAMILVGDIFQNKAASARRFNALAQ
jgi:hypothetical protein